MIAKLLTANLVKIAQAYARGKGTTLAAVGRRFYGNTRFFGQLRAGKRSISIHKYEEMIEAMRADWPDKTDWPFTRAIFIERRLH
jgi:hypothetical protein